MVAVFPPLRYQRFWTLCGLGLVLVILVLCLMPGDELPDVPLSDKFEHSLAFGSLALWFGGIRARRNYVWIGLALLVYGGLIELAQSAMGWGRNGDWLDLRADGVGIALGLVLALTPLGRWARWLESVLPAAAA
jgi:hypothetical protein